MKRNVPAATQPKSTVVVPSNQYSSESEEALVVSDDSDVKPSKKSSILQNSTTDDDSEQEIISHKKPTTVTRQPTTQPAKKETKKFQLDLTQEEKGLLTADQVQQLEKMANLVDSEILSEDEVTTKKENLVRQQRKKVEEEKRKEQERQSKLSQSKPVTKSSAPPSKEDQLKKLQDLLDAGILSDEEFETKKRQLFPEEASTEEEETTEDDDDDDKGLKLKLTPIQRDQLSKLDSLLEMGILEQDEYEEKKRQVMGLKKEKTPSRIIANKVQGNSEHGDVIEMVIFISNIKATPEQPFKLIYEGEHVMYERTEDTAPGKTIIVRGNIPKKPREDTVASLLVQMPAANIHTQQNFNLVEHGRFVQIVITQEGNRNNIRIKQQHDDKFDQEQQLGAKNDEMSKVYIHYSAVPATEEEPFRIWINELLAHQMTQTMSRTQSGVIRGTIPKVKRCNPSSESHHDIKLKIHIPMVDQEEKSYIVNLTDKGEHVGIFLDDGKITVRQSTTEIVDEDSPALVCVKSVKK